MKLKKGTATPLAFLVVSLIIAAMWTIGPYVFASRDIPSAIDSDTVRKRAEAACAEMVERMDAGTTVDVAARSMVAQVRALGAEAIDNDKPTERWLNDWDDLLDAYEAGRPIPEMGDGVRITRRMDDLVKDLDHCEVPDPLQPRNYNPPTPG
jgi:Na+-transporting methylmalonyl-CoA/oxaloacetate decarboxylase gamma subunit